MKNSLNFSIRRAYEENPSIAGSHLQLIACCVGDLLIYRSIQYSKFDVISLLLLRRRDYDPNPVLHKCNADPHIIDEWFKIM